MSGVRAVRYAASDPVVGGTNLNCSEKLRTDYVLRTMNEDRIDRFLNPYRIDYARAVELGRKWFETNRLHDAMKKQLPISEIISEIGEELSQVGS